MNLSIVIPLLNEEESLKELHDWIVQVMQSNHFLYEILFIDDGSTDDSWKIIEELSLVNENVKGLRFLRNFGKSQALHAGFAAANGDVVITMDADLQDNPEEIPELYKMIQNEDFDLVSGWKKKRYDSVVSKNLPSKLFNWAARRTSGVKLHDFNCGLKAYKNAVVKNIEVSGEMHRYIPVLAKNAGYANIGEKVVQHQARKYGVTKFGLSRFIYGPLDLFSIMFVGKFGKRPMHFFGVIGILISMLGTCLLGYLSISKLFFDVNGIANRPAFFLGMLLIIVGIQLFIAGFVAELVSRSAYGRNKYKIESRLGL